MVIAKGVAMRGIPIEDKLATDEQFAGLSTKQAEVVARETQRVLMETGNPELAKAVSRRLIAGMKQAVHGRDRAGKIRNLQDVTVHNARQRANEMVGNTRRINATQELPSGREGGLIGTRRHLLPRQRR
jgi:hypothetical protein